VPSPIITPENLQGLNVILEHDHPDGLNAVVKWKVYSNGFTPANGKIDAELDHIAIIETVYKKNKDGTPSNDPAGYQAIQNSKFYIAHPEITQNFQWVFRSAIDQTSGGANATKYTYWSNQDSGGGTTSIYKVLTGFRMIVDDLTDFRDKKNRTNTFYETNFTYFNHLNNLESVPIEFPLWGDANQAVYNQLFAGSVATDAVLAAAKLPDLSTVAGRKQAGWGGHGDRFHWIQFTQFVDPKVANSSLLPPFVFDVNYGIQPFAYSGSRKSANTNFGEAMGIYNQTSGTNKVNTITTLSIGMMDTEPFKLPDTNGAILQPRIYTTKFTIPVKTYTYQALAQLLTDKINAIPGIVTGQSNDPFPAPVDEQPPISPTSPNIRAFSNSRFLTTTTELSMQQKEVDSVSGNLPFFPSRFTYTDTDSPPTSQPLVHPIWLSTDGKDAFQTSNSINVVNYGTPRWEGAESVSVIFDETSQAFQIAQAHSNIYSRLDGGVIVRQFRTGIPAGSGPNDIKLGNLVTCDKSGGIFFTSLEPKSLWYDKMLFNQNICVSQFGNNPTVKSLLSDTSGGIEADTPANEMLSSVLTHSLDLRVGTTTTGNFMGTTLNIDKRIRTFNPPVTGAAPTIDVNGGLYQVCDPNWILDVATNTPISIPGKTLAQDDVTDPFFQVEISGMNRQNVLGSSTKNNLIQSIVGKYFTNGGFTSGNIDDGFRYTHVGEPILLRSLSVRILDSDGAIAVGLGGNSAIILEVDTVK